MLDELHISSLVVHATPKRRQQVEQAIAGIPGAQVHASSATGKIIITLEARTLDEMSAKVAGIQHTEGVLSAALVYQCVDSLAAMNEEIPDANAPAGLH